eukprot:2185089-Ditylum_brightwellii.AAC.1
MAGIQMKDIETLKIEHTAIRREEYEKVIVQQSSIGWKQIQYGRFGTEWSRFQEKYNKKMRYLMKIPRNEQWLGQ